MAPRLTDAEVAFVRALRSLEPCIGVSAVVERVAKLRKDQFSRAGKKDPGYNAARPSKSAISRLISGLSFNDAQKKKAKIGRPSKITPSELRRLPKIVDKLEQKNPDCNVVARMINAEWGTNVKVSDKYLPELLKKCGKPWKKALRKQKLTEEGKKEAATWCKTYARKPKSFWSSDVCAIDCKSWSFQTSKRARKQARCMNKTGSYRSAADGHLSQHTAPSRLKHRQSAKSINILNRYLIKV